jgi:hypothetical protein
MADGCAPERPVPSDRAQLRTWPRAAQRRRCRRRCRRRGRALRLLGSRGSPSPRRRGSLRPREFCRNQTRPRKSAQVTSLTSSRPRPCARAVSGVGLGPSCYAASLLWSPGPRPSPVFRSAICDCLSLNVSLSVSCGPGWYLSLPLVCTRLLPRSPGPYSPPVLRSAICDCFS